MPDQTCPFSSRCWMAGNYVFCKTANCKEPLIERGESPATIVTPPPVVEEPPSETIDNGGEIIQGELF